MLLHKQRGGAWIGDDFFKAWQVSWPLASLELYDDRIVLTAFPRENVSIPVKDVTSIKKLFFIPVILWGIKINHRSDSSPPFTIFWCLSTNRILSLFQQIGVPVV